MKRLRGLRAIPFDIRLRDALGERLRVLPGDCAKYAVGGVVPKSVALPRDAREAALALEAASAEGAIVALRGAGTKSHRAPPPRDVDVVVDTSALSGVTAHAAEDLTVTVGAGTTLAKLEAVLAAAGQFWPCDAPFGETATVGGTIAANAEGALRLRYGLLRETVLGARIVTPDGVIVRSGSRVVKSVAGYDIHKLMAGSRGTLGLILEVTLKVVPLPEVERIAIARFASAVSACAVGRQIAGSNLFPMAMTLHDENASRKSGAFLAHAATGSWLLAVRCGGNRRAVARQIAEIGEACMNGGAQSTAALDAADVRRAWKDVRELFGGAHYSANEQVGFKIACLPTDLASAIAAVRTELPSCEMSAQPAAGIVHAHVAASALTGDASALTRIFERGRRAGWNASVLSAPASSAAHVPLDVQAAAPVRLFRTVKAAFDPAGVLDPGRMPGGV